MSPGQRKRLRRIELRASQPVKDAFARSLISARCADRLLYLVEPEQQTELERILHDREQMALRCKAAVQTIKRHLNSGSKDLLQLRSDLREACKRVS
jgi:hypothetical protein